MCDPAWVQALTDAHQQRAQEQGGAQTSTTAPEPAPRLAA